MDKSNFKIKDEQFVINSNIVADTRKIIKIATKIKKVKLENQKIVYNFIKRIIDIIGALVGMVLLIPTTIGIYIAKIILNEDNGPLFYEHLRYGKNGKQFKLYKFRSMCMNADEQLKDYLNSNEEARKEFEEKQKLQNDPRITKLGKFLRKTSLDELPQMLNILKGEMSFVGPRPVVAGEIEKYGKNRDKFLSVKPGLTGYWQINGRSNTTYEERINLELYYVDHRSLWLDIKIFFVSAQ